MKVVFFANSDWYLFNFRLPLARDLAVRGIEVVMASPPGPYSRKLEDAGFRWQAIEMSRRRANPREELSSLAALIRLYRREKPDLVHHFTLKSIVQGSLAARVAGVPAVVNAVAGLGYLRSKTRFARLVRRPLSEMLRRSLGGRGTHVIVQNPDDLRLLVDGGLVAHDRVSLIRGSGVDTSRFAPRARSGEKDIRVLFCARLLREKGIGDFVEAARVVRALRPEIVFEVAGEIDEGNPGSVTRQQVDAWRAEGVVSFLGHVDDMRPLYDRADLIALPSVYGEGVPRSLIEGAASGLPILTTDAPGCREVVEDGVNGFLLPPHDVPALARAVLGLADDPERRLCMGRVSRERALAHFDQRAVFDATFAVYEALVSSGQR